MKFEVDGYKALKEALEYLCATLAAEGVSEQVTFDSKLVLDELVSNVLQHGGGIAHICVELGQEMRITVRGDNAFRPPEKSTCSGVNAERGRGLFLVDTLVRSRAYSEEEGICVVLSLD